MRTSYCNAPRRLINSDSTRNYNSREIRRKPRQAVLLSLSLHASQPSRGDFRREGLRGARRGAAANVRSTGKQYYKHHAGPPGARLARVRWGMRGEAGRGQREKDCARARGRDDQEQASDADDAAGI